jgi:hypothetical protein
MSKILAAVLAAIALCFALAPSGPALAQTETPPPAPPAQDAPAPAAAAQANAAGREFRFVSTGKVSTMEKELNELAAEGFRLERVSKSLAADDMAALVSREAAPAPAEAATATATAGPRYEYKVLATTREKTTQKEISEALAEGFRILDLTTIGEFILILGRQGGNTSAGVK